MRTATVVGLLLLLGSVAHGALAEEPERYYRLARLDLAWAAASVPEDAWKGVAPIAISTCVHDPGKNHRQFAGSFRIAWHDQGLIVQVDSLDTDHQPPGSRNPDSVKQPFTHDSIEVWLNSSQFVIYDLDGVATVAGYPAGAWSSAKDRQLLAQARASFGRNGDHSTYLLCIPWAVFVEDPAADAIPGKSLFGLAVGINDKDAEGYAQFYSPPPFKFGEPTTFATGRLATSGDGGTAAEWAASVGSQPVCCLDYDLEGFICLHLKCGETFLSRFSQRQAEISVHVLGDPDRVVKIGLDRVERGRNRLPEALLIPALEGRICEFTGRLQLDDQSFRVTTQCRLIPIRGGMTTYTLRQPAPPDFAAFWQRLATDALAVPLQGVVSEHARNPNGSIAYKVVLNGADGIPSVGFLTVPKDTTRRYPCLISGNGYGGKNGPSDQTGKGLVTFNHNTRGQGFSLELHDFKDYLITLGAPDREKYYYRQAYMDFLRVIEFAARHPNVDPERIGLVGGSQGGALAIVGAALDKRIRLLSVVDPGFCGWEVCCDMYEEGHYGSFLRLTRAAGGPDRQTMMEFLKYYDMAYLCPWITCPTLFVNDYLCFPEGKAAAYNNLPAQPKRLFSYPGATHCYVDQAYRDTLDEWIGRYLLAPAAAPP